MEVSYSTVFSTLDISINIITNPAKSSTTKPSPTEIKTRNLRLS